MASSNQESLPDYFLTVYLQSKKLEERLTLLCASKFVTEKPNELAKIFLIITQSYTEDLLSKKKKYEEGFFDRAGIEDFYTAITCL